MRISLLASLWSAASGHGLVALTSSGLGEGSYSAVTLNSSTAVTTALLEDKAASATSDSAMDAKHAIHYLFEDGFVIRHFDIAARAFSKQVFVDLDPCTAGCVAELFWDSTREQLLTVSMGLNGNNSLATLDPGTGKLAALPHTGFPVMCGLVEGGAAYDVVGQTLFATLDCVGGASITGVAIYAFDVSAGAPSGSGLRPVLQAPHLSSDFPTRLAFGGGQLLGWTYDSTARQSALVAIANNTTTPVVGGIPGGIESRTTTVSPQGVLYGITSGQTPAVVAVDLASKTVNISTLDLPDGADISQLRAY